MRWCFWRCWWRLPSPRWESCWWWWWRWFPPPGGKFPRRNRSTEGQNCSCPSSALRRWCSILKVLSLCFSTVIYDVFMHNNAFWSNSNAISLIICKVHTKRENSGSWKSGPGKAMSGHLFCTTPNTLKLHGYFLWYIWRILEQITTRGGPPGGHNPPGRAKEPRRALVGCAHLVGPLWYLFAPIFIIYFIKILHKVLACLELCRIGSPT